MADAIDRVGSLASDHVSGLANDSLMKSSPVWAQLRGEISALQALVIAQKASYNALLAKLDSNHGAATDHVSTLAVTAVDPAL